MFNLVRFFLLSSVTATAVIVVALMFHRHQEVKQLIRFAEDHNVELARSFANMIWPKFASHVIGASQLYQSNAASLLRRHRTTLEIQHAVETISDALPILKVQIYSVEGLTVYSSALDEIGEMKSNNPGFFAAARDGIPASRLTYKGSMGPFSKFTGRLLNRDLVESYLPIRQGDGPVEGVIELYTDVTAMLAAIQRSTVNLAVSAALVFGSLFGVLYLMVRRANRTIEWQYANIAEKNEDLQREISERERAEAALKNAQDELEQRVDARTRELTEEIAERKRAEGEAQQNRRELARIGAVITVGEMATTLAHELSQPLAVISGCAQFCLKCLRTGAREPAQLLDSIEQLAEQTERVNDIVHQVRNFFRKEEPDRRPANVNDVIHSIVDLLQFDARAHGVALELDLSDSLPQVILDPVQIRQVMLNLSHNGMEAMSEVQQSRRQLNIRTFVDECGLVQVTVQDCGGSIAPHMFDKVFDPFFTTKIDGLGMGLTISRSIVHAHGGQLWVTLEQPSQTIFHFTLPIEGNGRNDDC